MRVNHEAVRAHMSHMDSLSRQGRTRKGIGATVLANTITQLRLQYELYGQPTVSEAELATHALVTCTAELGLPRPEDQRPIILGGI